MACMFRSGCAFLLLVSCAWHVHGVREEFFGEDLKGPSQPHAIPNSEAAASAFAAKYSSITTVDFESSATGAINGQAFNFGPAGTGTFSGPGDVITSHNDVAGWFGTPLFGSKMLLTFAGSQGMTVTFTNPVNGLGFYAADLGDQNTPAQFKCKEVGSGTFTTYTIPHTLGGTANGAIAYYGFFEDDSTKYCTQIVLESASGSNDGFFFDNFAVGDASQVASGSCTTSPIDLRVGWQSETMMDTVHLGVGSNWTVAQDGTSVTQQINGAPSAFVRVGSNAKGRSFEGTFEVRTTSDDDLIGFVLGYDLGEAQSQGGADYIIVDWKQLAQGGVPPGIRALRHKGGTGQTSCSAPIGANPFWVGNVTDCGISSEILGAGNIGGWQDRTVYKIKFDYTTTRLRVWVDDVLQMDISGTDFPDGPFGFYNLSQDQVFYGSFVEGCSEFPDTGGNQSQNTCSECTATATAPTTAPYSTSATSTGNAVKLCFVDQ